MKPEWITIKLFDDAKGIGTGNRRFPDEAQDIITWLQGHLAKVPEEHRDKVCLELESDTDINIRLEYYRPQTPEEMEAAEKKKAADTAIQERLDRATFEELKRRFEP